MNKIFFVLLILVTSLSYSQDLLIKNNPFDNANEYTLKRNSFRREKWFYEQRMYPNNYILYGNSRIYFKLYKPIKTTNPDAAKKELEEKYIKDRG